MGPTSVVGGSGRSVRLNSPRTRACSAAVAMVSAASGSWGSASARPCSRCRNRSWCAASSASPYRGGVAVVVDAQAPAVGAVVDVDGQVLDRARRQVPGPGGRAREIDAVVEGHDVDERSHQAAVLAEQAQVAADVLVAVALVAARFADAEHHVPYQLREARLGGDGQPQRKHVHHHARDTQRHRTHAAHQGQAQHHVRLGGGAGGVEGLRGDQHVRPGRAEPPGGPTRHRAPRPEECPRAPPRSRTRRSEPLAGSRRTWPAGRPGAPRVVR